MLIKKSKVGSTIFEAVIASVIIMIAVVAYSNVQISNFVIVVKSNKEEQISYALTDFADKLRTQTANRTTVGEKQAIITEYVDASWNVPENTCVDNIPDYIKDCLNDDISNITLCDTEKVVKWDIYEAACNISATSLNAIINLNYCVGSGTNLCIWVSTDGNNKTENQCRNDINTCMLMEIKP